MKEGRKGGREGRCAYLGPFLQRPVASAHVEEVVDVLLVDLHVGDEDLREGGREGGREGMGE
jgi:hypothetical protein